MKKLTIIIVSLFITICPCLTFCDFSFAEDQEIQWSNVNDKNVFTAAMKAYAKASKGLSTGIAFTTIDDPIVHAVVDWSYSRYVRAAQTLGIDLNELQHSIKSRVDNNGALQFLYSSSYISLYNQLINQYMIEQGLSPNAQYNDKNVYSGKFFTDLDGNTCFIYKSAVLKGGSNTSFDDLIIQYGSTYINSGTGWYTHFGGVAGNYSYTMNFSENKTFDCLFQLETTDHSALLKQRGNTSSTIYYYNSKYDEYRNGDTIIYEYNGDIYLGTLTSGNYKFNNYNYYLANSISITDLNTYDVDVNITKEADPDSGIEDGKQALIDLGKLGGDIGAQAVKYLNDNEPEEPQVDPDYKGGTPNFPKPTGKSWPTGVSMDGNGGFNFQMPDLNIDWSLDFNTNNLPFPFSIPNDIYNAFNSLNVEAEAPHFDGTIDLVVTQWDIDIDFSDYSDLANIVNKWFLFVYVVGLIIATRSLMHIY